MRQFVPSASLAALLSVACCGSAKADPVPFALDSQKHFIGLQALLKVFGKVEKESCPVGNEGDPFRACTLHFGRTTTVALTARRGSSAFHQASVFCKRETTEQRKDCETALLAAAVSTGAGWTPESVQSGMRAAGIALADFDEVRLKDSESRVLVAQDLGKGALAFHIQSDAKK